MSRKHNPSLLQQNPIRALVADAEKIVSAASRCAVSEASDRIIELQLGNPRFNEAPIISDVMIEAIRTRAVGEGYDPHFGTKKSRAAISAILHRMYATLENGVNPSWENVTMTNGATMGVNAAIEASKIRAVDPEGIVLLSNPGYPPYESIVGMHGMEFRHYYLSSEEGYFFTYEGLKTAIEACDPARVRLLIYNYPHNPTGATPDKEQAIAMAKAVSKINREYPHVVFLEESLYYGTVAAGFPLWAPYSFLDRQARDSTILVGSGSKVGLAGPRAGFVYSSDRALAASCANYVSLSSAGTGYIPHAGYIAALELLDLHPGQVIVDQENPRWQISSYFQERMSLMSSGIEKLCLALNIKPSAVLGERPNGGMYLWADFAPIFHGKRVPHKLAEVMGRQGATFQSARDIQESLLWMRALGHPAVLIAPGDIFGDKEGMKARLSCVSSDLKDLNSALSTISELVRLSF